MRAKLNDPVKCEFRSEIRFLKKKSPYWNLEVVIKVYGYAMNEASVRKLCIMFNDVRKNIRDKKLSGWPSVVIDEDK